MTPRQAFDWWVTATRKALSNAHCAVTYGRLWRWDGDQVTAARWAARHARAQRQAQAHPMAGWAA